jgi:hypothetical protein
MPFDLLLAGYERAEATPDERNAIFQGRQGVLLNILKRAESLVKPLLGHEDCLAIYSEQKLVAIARRDQGVWGLERVFTPDAL